MKGKRHGGAGFHHKHSLGQNFIEDEALLEQLAELSLAGAQDCVLEIGPGFGALLPILRVTLEGSPNARVVHGDVMRTDLAALVREAFGEGAPLRVAANLPYYITTDVLLKLLRELPQARSYAVMVQREVGNKLMSAPGDDGYGPLAILCQYFCEVRRALDVPAACFTPPPKVDSSFMVLERRASPLCAPADEALFLRLIRAAFAMRRKTLLNNLTAGLSLTREQAAQAIAAAGLEEGVRGEALSIGQLCALADRIHEAKTGA